ncbi:AAA domain-containing protein [Phytoactinopolyspora alkaliphila]|uniref:AAA domain-containing protein n=1 Tax=Phytoactinopolyspora alkaliphila TaxID=1783498 RepID=A0A6N9YIP7_9ACTN|nr:AAA family ATPase [Phytoactinopolyspora alkaliphila]NED94778.1 AAA domain-containing protein [Phytoactinopolyspora alkaliphila]
MLENGLGTGASYLEPQTSAWSPASVEDLRHRYNERPDESSDKFLVKLQRQLSDAPDSTILLAAELLMLHALPLSNLTRENKRRRIETVLGWMREPASLPPDVIEAFAEGSWHGGQGANQNVWRWLANLVEVVEAWWTMPSEERAQALRDPWTWRDIVRSADMLPSLQECLLYLAFPQYFLPSVSTSDKRRIREAFKDVGQQTNDHDRDLFDITLTLQERAGGAVDYYQTPYVEQWRSPSDRAARRAWLVRPRPPQTGDDHDADRWRNEGLVSLAAAHLRNVEPGSDRSVVAAAVEDGYQHSDYAQRLRLTTEYHSFLTRMASGDLVVTVRDGSLWIGEVTGEASYVENESPVLTRSVDWADQLFPVEDVPTSLAADLDQQGSLVDLTGDLDALDTLIALDVGVVDEGPALPPGVEADIPTLKQATVELSDHLNIEREWLQDALDVLQDRQQMIFYGPPGTGKTYIARELGRHVTDRDAVQLVQFHPSYTYEDFFEGYRPAPMADGVVGFQLQPGPLRRLAVAARENPTRPYVLIIDEINRANLAKVFGELYYLLEYRREPVLLQYSPGVSFSLPPNLFLIGTMNTADRSIALMDAAIRRRFAFMELHPDEAPVKNMLRTWLRQGDKDLDRADLLDALNAAIGDEGRDFKIGPSYLMNPDVERYGGLARVWRYSILPLLEEHYYGRMSREEVNQRFGLDTVRARATKHAGTAYDVSTGTTAADEGSARGGAT